MKNTVTKSILFAILTIVVGAIIIYVGIGQVNKYKDKKSEYIEVEAKVVAHDPAIVDDEGSYAIYEYIVDGETYRAQSNTKTTTPPAIGKVETILYNPSNPNEVIFLGSTNYMILIIGIVFEAFGLLLVGKVVSLKKQAKNITYDNTNINDIAGPNMN